MASQSLTCGHQESPGGATTRAPLDDVELHELIRRQPVGSSLLQEFYTSEAIYRRDVEKVILSHWHCAGHESQIPNAGDFFLFEIDKESVIVVRGQDGAVRALINVCRHRGSRICSEQVGRARGGVFVCPYHAWVYNTDGSLKNARFMEPDFDASTHGLRQAPLASVEGLLFISLADTPLEVSSAREMLMATVRPYGWATAKVIHHECYTIKANWKLALENQVECYHCAPSHPEFFRVHSQGRLNIENLRLEMLERTHAQGIHIPTCDNWALKAAPGQESDYCSRYGMWDKAVTASKDGSPIAPLMGDFKEYDGGFTIFYVGPLNHFLAYPDYGAIFRYSPRAATETDLHVTWLVRGDAQENKDYEIDRVTWLWQVTAAADKRIVEENQIGVNSRFYVPGPYALPIESSTRRFTEWYLKELIG